MVMLCEEAGSTVVLLTGSVEGPGPGPRQVQSDGLCGGAWSTSGPVVGYRKAGSAVTLLMGSALRTAHGHTRQSVGRLGQY